MEIRYCEVDQVQIGARLRSLDTKKIAALAESMEAIGLQQPISVWSPNGQTLDLVAGLHRLEAARKLGWEDIDCIFVNMDYLTRQLWEIDENLMRTDLSPAELAQHTAKRADLVRQRAVLVNVQVEQKPAHHPSEGQAEFVEETAKNTGKSKMAVRRDKARGEKIPIDVLAKVQGTDLDTGTYLDKLKKLAHDEQREKVDHDLKEIELKEIERAKNEALEMENWRPKHIISEFKRDHEQIAARMEKLGLDDDDWMLVDKWSKSLKLTSEKDKWENQALDLHEKGEPLKAALRQTKKAHNLESAQIKEEQEKREAKRLRHYAEQEDIEFQDREPFEFFAEFLLQIVPNISLYDSHHYEHLIRHLKNCKLTKLTAALERLKAEWDAEDEQISA